MEDPFMKDLEEYKAYAEKKAAITQKYFPELNAAMAAGNMEEISRITAKINEEAGPKPKLALEQEAKSAEQRMKDQENVARAAQLIGAPWKCGFCGGMNTGKFCTNCGAPRG